MNGTFNGFALRQITFVTMTMEASGFKRTTIRVIGKQPKLEQILQLNTPALLI